MYAPLASCWIFYHTHQFVFLMLDLQLFHLDYTIENNFFVECLKHSAKPGKHSCRLYRVWHSTKKARWTIHRQRLLCRVLFVMRTIDKDSLFVECHYQHGKHSAKSLSSVTLGKESSANCTSATASLPSTFYRVLDKDYAECRSVLGKEKPPLRRLVTETTPLPSVLGDTRQRDYLCRVH
jgi:hypothetical protein